MQRLRCHKSKLTTEEMSLSARPRPGLRRCVARRRHQRAPATRAAGEHCLSSRAIATACELRPSHAGLRSYCEAAEPPAGDGSRRSAPPTSRDDHRWSRAATHEPSAAHASHAMLGAARAPRQPAAAEHSTLREQCRRAHAAIHGDADASRPSAATGRAGCWPALPRVQPCRPGCTHGSCRLPRCARAAQTPGYRCTMSRATPHGVDRRPHDIRT